MKILVVLGAAAALLATSAAEAATAQEQTYILTLQKRVRATLKDPKSAQFSGSYVSRRGGVPVVCGRVNSRNGFGGYTGPQRFLAAGDTIAVDEQMAPGEMNKVWARFC